MKMKIVHMVNAIELPPGPHPAYLHIAQPVTLQSMLNAKQMAVGVAEVELVATRHRNEQIPLPAGFVDAPCFDRYCHEVYDELRGLPKPRHLPLLADLMKGFAYVPNADWCVFTNVDIGVQPHFYLEVARLIGTGLDAFCINRQNLPKEAYGVVLDAEHLPLIYATPGEKAGGTDCFVFRSAFLPKLRLGRVFVGYPPIGQVLRKQIEALADRFDWFWEERLTFHLGNDRVWRDDGSCYQKVNLEEEQRILAGTDREILK